MDIRIEDITENEDGSAILHVQMDEEAETKFKELAEKEDICIEEYLRRIVEQGVEEFKDEDKARVRKQQQLNSVRDNKQNKRS